MSVNIREELHKIIDQVESDQVLRAVYTLLEKEVREDIDFKLSPEQEAELDRRAALHRSGESKSYSWEESLKKIRSGQ